MIVRIGVDLDNTLICYDEAFQRVAREEGLLPATFRGDKKAVKRALLARRGDGYLWERLQGLVYGRRIDAAVLFDGVRPFLEACRRRAVQVVIVSHKTERAHHDPANTDLRAAAVGWMADNGLFDRRGQRQGQGLGLGVGDVFFEATRDAKIQRIAALGVDLFIDDLVEVLEHEAMPAGCRKILFGQEPQQRFEQYATWPEVQDAVLGPA